ncbi:MAG: hypothetical protein OEL89_04970, partial [Candidatus Peregrinibacteria bacterium]|nr:hypothetical protein [Candidatus Peregrinibacteria bacterium]
MFEKLNIILNTSLAEVLNSPLSADLLRLYSYIYANNCAVGFCATSQTKYYKQIHLNGLEMLQKKEDLKNRTCVPNWIGNKYFHKAATFYSANNMTDSIAIELLKSGVFTESNFKVLPTDLNVIKNTEINNDCTSEDYCILEIAECLSIGMSSKQIKEKYSNVEKIGDKTADSKYF